MGSLALETRNLFPPIPPNSLSVFEDWFGDEDGYEILEETDPLDRGFELATTPRSLSTKVGRSKQDLESWMISLPARFANSGGVVVLKRPSRVETSESGPASTVRSKFLELADEWRNSTKFVSSITQQITHPAYLKIIGLGPDVLPILVRELQTHGDFWFPALEAVAQLDPVLPKNRGNYVAMKNDWMEWATSKGLL